MITDLFDHDERSPDRIESPETDALERERELRGEIEHLYRLADAVNRATSLDGVFAAALDAVVAALHVERASILLFDPDRVIRFKAWRGLSAVYRTTMEGQSPWTPDTVDTEPIVVEDVEGDPSLADLRTELRAERIRAMALFPLVSEHQVIGKFVVYDAHPRRFTAREIRIATTIGIHVAQGVARQSAFDEAERQRERADAAARAKDLFLAVLSHELRTPLTAIVGWTQMLKTGVVPQERREKALDTIDRNARAQARLIEDLLDFSGIVAGGIHLNLKRVDMAEAVEQAVESLRPAADAKGVRLDVAIERSAGAVHADPVRLQQILSNLLSNAVKFTPHGGLVTVRLVRKGGEAIVEVVDTGEGIDPEFLPYVFDRFRQGHSGDVRPYGGLGLGLAIVRHLVELHGGSVLAESAGPGKGSTFRFRLPSTKGSSPRASSVTRTATRASH